MKVKINIDIKINRVIKFLVLSDLIFLGGWGLATPIFSIFVIEKIQGATLATVGFVTAIYWLVKSFLQIPVANYLDKKDGENDDYHALVLSLTLAGIASFGFAMTTHLWQLFLVQIIYAVAMAFYVPSWNAIFSRHLDVKKYSTDWSVDSTIVGLAIFLTTSLSGILAGKFGFSFVFFLVGVFSLVGAALLFSVPNLVIPGKVVENNPRLEQKPSLTNN